MSHQIERNLPAAVEAELAIDFTRPVFLVKMKFVTGEKYVSSGPQITFETNVYIEGQVSVGTFTWDADGRQTGQITLSNEANAASALILGNNVNDVIVEIYKTYLIAGGGNTAPQLWVLGSLDGGRVEPSKSVMRVLSTASETGFVPNRYYTVAEGFNWLPIDGEVVTWNGEVFQLKAET